MTEIYLQFLADSCSFFSKLLITACFSIFNNNLLFPHVCIIVLVFCLLVCIMGRGKQACGLMEYGLIYDFEDTSLCLVPYSSYQVANVMLLVMTPSASVA